MSSNNIIYFVIFFAVIFTIYIIRRQYILNKFRSSSKKVTINKTENGIEIEAPNNF